MEINAARRLLEIAESHQTVLEMISDFIKEDREMIRSLQKEVEELKTADKVDPNFKYFWDEFYNAR